MNRKSHDHDVIAHGFAGCGTADHWNRRTLLKAAGVAGAAWLTPLAERLSLADEQAGGKTRPRSVIMLWLQGGPSQLESFDPHPGSKYGGETQAIQTSLPGLQIGSTLAQTAELMHEVALVRSVTSKEGDHERATYNAKTGFRPDPTLIHPSIGAVLCHQLQDRVEIPRHVSILPNEWSGRGGYLGDQFDAFRIGDPVGNIPDVKPFVAQDRFDRRVNSLMNVVESEFARGRLKKIDEGKTLHRTSIQSAIRMMSSEQLKAFDVTNEAKDVRDQFGDTAFGRGCLAAIRLVEVGVRCVEVTLSGWDSHINNHELQTGALATLDPAFAALIRELKRRDLFDQTIVICGGEFGRTPTINPAGGRDHWPHGFSVALAGGNLRRGVVVGETSPDPKLDKENPLQDVAEPHNIEDIHATVLHALGIDFERELETPIGRPMAISKGRAIPHLLA
ncbi:MAG: DUF1501 domain-containing protein [Planctomycetales bacterium]|nr:DUF1501 domain-containing protein [Planctomycetales bacterium]